VHFHPRPGQRTDDTQLRPVTNTDFHAALRTHGEGLNGSRENPDAKAPEAGLSHSSVSWDSTVQALGKDNTHSSAYSSACECDDRLSYPGDTSDDASYSYSNPSESVRSSSRSSYDTDHLNCGTPVGGFEHLLPPPELERDKKPAVDHGERSCNCIEDHAAFAPLVNLSVALRTSREALEYLHPAGIDCLFFSRVILLENHIFSVSPQQAIFNHRSSLSSTGTLRPPSNTNSTEVSHPSSHYTTMHPRPPRASSPVHHLPEHSNTQDQNRGQEPFAYLDHPMVYAPQRKWS